MTAIRLPVLRAENVVDAHIHAALVEGPSRSQTSGYKAVGQAVGHHPPGIRQGIVVEVAAHDHGHALVHADIGGHSQGLGLADNGSLGQAADEQARGADHLGCRRLSSFF